MSKLILAAVLALACAASAFVLPSGEVFDLPYDGCGTKVGCLGLPSGDADCVAAKNCDSLLTYSKGKTDGTVQLTLYSQNASDTSDGNDHYISAGINNQQAMNLSTIVNCFNKAAGGITFSSSFALKHAPPVTIKLPELVATAGTLNGNLLTCKISLKTSVNTNDQSYDLTKPTYLIMAGGIANANNTVQYHFEYKTITDQAVVIAM